MRHVRTLGLCLVAVFALSALTASGAWASGLVLKEGATVAPVGASTTGAVLIHGCVLETEGTLGSNGKGSDKAAFSTNITEEGCEAGYSLAGKVIDAKLTAAGTMSFKAGLTLGVPGPCNYSIKKYTIKFNPNALESTIGEGEATAKLSKTGSSPSCAKRENFTLLAGVLHQGGGPFNTETT